MGWVRVHAVGDRPSRHTGPLAVLRGEEQELECESYLPEASSRARILKLDADLRLVFLWPYSHLCLHLKMDVDSFGWKNGDRRPLDLPLERLVGFSLAYSCFYPPSHSDYELYYGPNRRLSLMPTDVFKLRFINRQRPSNVPLITWRYQKVALGAHHQVYPLRKLMSK
jgi:hypothetical protein